MSEIINVSFEIHNLQDTKRNELSAEAIKFLERENRLSHGMIVDFFEEGYLAIYTTLNNCTTHCIEEIKKEWEAISQNINGIPCNVIVETYSKKEFSK